MFLGHKAGLNCTESMQTNTFTRCGVLKALSASGCSQDYTGVVEVQPSPGLLSCSGGSAFALSVAPNCMFFCNNDFIGNHTEVSLISCKAQCIFAVVPRKQPVASFTASLFPTFCLQVRSLTSARCVEKPLVRAPTSSPTVGSTQASSPLAVICVAKASNERWIYGDTGRHSTA